MEAETERRMGAAMTDRERRRALCDKLHRKGFIIAGEEIMKMQLEIERLGRLTKYLEAKLEDLERRND